jgi:hypothetical protein
MRTAIISLLIAYPFDIGLFGDRFVTACDRLCQISKKAVTLEASVYAGLGVADTSTKPATKLPPTCHNCQSCKDGWENCLIE